MCQTAEATKYRKSQLFISFFFLFLKSYWWELCLTYLGKKWSNSTAIHNFFRFEEKFLFWPINSQLYSNITLGSVSMTEGTLILKLMFSVSQLCQGKTHLSLHNVVSEWELDGKFRRKGKKKNHNNQHVECSLSHPGFCPLRACPLSIFISEALMLKSSLHVYMWDEGAQTGTFQGNDSLIRCLKNS